MTFCWAADDWLRNMAWGCIRIWPNRRSKPSMRNGAGAQPSSAIWPISAWSDLGSWEHMESGSLSKTFNG
jgi:hypothetical protein